MLLKTLFLFLFSFLSLEALVIQEDKNIYEFNDFKIYQDKNNIINIDKAIDSKERFKKAPKSNIGIKKHPVWTYGKIVNNTKTLKRLIFANPRAGIDFMDIYFLKDKQVIKKFNLGDMNPLENRIIKSRKSNFLLELLPKQEYEIFIKYKSFGAIDINLQVYQPRYYANLVNEESMEFGLIIGFTVFILIALILLISYFPSVPAILFFFILFGTVAIQLSVAGVLYEMELNSYLNTITSWSLGNIAAALIGVFPIYYFNLKQIMPKTTIILYFLSSIIFLLSFMFLFYPIKNELLYLAPYANMTFFVISLVLLFVSINLSIKKIDGYKVYLLGNTLFLIFVVYFILGLLGIVPTNNLFYLSLGIGTFLNILCLGFLVILKLVKIKEDKENAMALLNEYSKLSSVGQSMINLSHQWKEPLNHIYYAINNITAAKEFNDPKLLEILDKNLLQIKNTATYMTNTGKNFLSLYEDETHSEEIDLKTSIESVLILFRKSIDELNINLDLNLQSQIKLNTNKYLLANVFMAIIENSIKTFKARNIKNPKLSISLKKELDKILIEICDNAGGVEEDPINSIFEKDLTNSKSTGLGLYLVKSILTLKLNGNIEVENKNKGACFMINLFD